MWEVTEITVAARQRSLIIPREHGAWGILLVPLLTGASAGVMKGGDGRAFVPFSLVALALFWMRTPLESWAGLTPIRVRTSADLRLVRTAILLLATIATGGLIWLFWGGRNQPILWIAGAAGSAFLIRFLIRWIWQSARTAAQMVGAAGLTLTAPAAYYVAAGHLGLFAWSLWVANLLFAVNQIHFVHLRIRSARATNRREKLAMGRGFFFGQVLLLSLVVTACDARVFPWYAATAFLPVLVRGFGWFLVEPQPLVIHALGKIELLYACVFGVLIVIGMRFL